jgi:hypothetical protein
VPDYPGHGDVMTWAELIGLIIAVILIYALADFAERAIDRKLKKLKEE